MNKKILIIILILLEIFSLFLLGSTSYASSENVIDTTQSVYSMYDSFNSDMLVRVYNLSNGSLSQKYTYNQIVNYFKNPDYSYFVTYNNWNGSSFYNSFSSNQTTLYLNFYKKSGLTNNLASIDNWALIDTQMRELSSSSKIISFEFVSDEVDDLEQSANSTFYLPRILIGYYPQTTVDFVSAINNNDTSLLQQIVANSERTATATEKIQEFIEDRTVDPSSYNQTIPTVPDSGSSDLDSSFNLFKGLFTQNERVIQIPVPHSNKTIDINPNFIRQALSEHGGSGLIVLIELVYNVLLARFIVKDVNKYITKLKDGSIATDTESNIKSDML